MIALVRNLLAGSLIGLLLLALYLLHGQLQESAKQQAQLLLRNAQQAEQLAQQTVQAQAQAAATRQLADQLDAISRQHIRTSQQLKETLHATADAQLWATTALPAGLVQLLQQLDADSPALTDQPTLPNGEPLPLASDDRQYQSATGRQLATTPNGAKPVRHED